MARGETGLMDRLERVSGFFQGARRVLFVTGAGVSAESGLPTYRGVGGLYHDVLTDDGVAIEEALSGAFFERHPEVTWKYLHQMERAARGARPNGAHLAMAALEARLDRVVIFTQNVDGLHREAGSREVIDIHGDLRTLRCTGCGRRRRVADFSDLAPLPRCAGCGAVERPDVVLFGELLPEDKLARLERTLARGVDLVVSVGTSSQFAYVVGPVVTAARAGVPTVEINPERTAVSRVVDVHLPLPAGDAMSRLGLVP